MTLFLEVSLALAWLLASTGLAIVAIYQWGEHGPARGLPPAVLAFVVTAGGLTAMVKAYDTAMDRCLDSGRAWAITGHHVAFVYNAATKTSLPHTVTDYGCVDRR